MLSESTLSSLIFERVRYSLGLLGMFVVAVLGLQAQSITTGDVTGTAKDPSGAGVPGATITLQNTGTGLTQTQTTNAEGQYRFSLVSPGTYTIRAAATGFSNAEVRGLTVLAGQPAIAN